MSFERKNNLTVLILAAGSSSRLGRPKQLLKINEKTLLEQAIDSALEVSEKVVVVLGANEKLIRPSISKLPIEVVLNQNWKEGMSSSIRTGVSFLEKKSPQPILIMVCDQPYIDGDFLRKMSDIFFKNEYLIIAAEYGGNKNIIVQCFTIP